MVKTLNEMKRHNKKVGGHFFDSGNPDVLAKRGNFLVTESFGGDGFVIYKYDSKTGKIRLVENPKGDYGWQPYTTKREAVRMADQFSKGKYHKVY